MIFFLYTWTSALIIYISPSRPKRNLVQLCIAWTNKPATHLLLEHIYFHGWPAWLTAHQKYCYFWKIRENTNDKIIAIFINLSCTNTRVGAYNIRNPTSSFLLLRYVVIGQGWGKSAWHQMCPGKRNFCLFSRHFCKSSATCCHFPLFLQIFL